MFSLIFLILSSILRETNIIMYNTRHNVEMEEKRIAVAAAKAAAAELYALEYPLIPQDDKECMELAYSMVKVRKWTVVKTAKRLKLSKHRIYR